MKLENLSNNCEKTFLGSILAIFQNMSNICTNVQMLLKNELFRLVPNLTYRGRCETRRFEVTSNQIENWEVEVAYTTAQLCVWLEVSWFCYYWCFRFHRQLTSFSTKHPFTKVSKILSPEENRQISRTSLLISFRKHLKNLEDTV